MQILSKVLIILSIMLGSFIVLTPNTAFADDVKCTLVVDKKTGDWVTEGGIAGGATEIAACEGAAEPLIGKLLRFVNVLSALVIVFAVGMIIYAGFKYITSQGDPKQVESAKQQLWYSGVGLFIVLTAFTILQLFKNASGQ